MINTSALLSERVLSAEPVWMVSITALSADRARWYLPSIPPTRLAGMSFLLPTPLKNCCVCCWPAEAWPPLSRLTCGMRSSSRSLSRKISLPQRSWLCSMSCGTSWGSRPWKNPFPICAVCRGYIITVCSSSPRSITRPWMRWPMMTVPLHGKSPLTVTSGLNAARPVRRSPLEKNLTGAMSTGMCPQSTSAAAAW